MAQAALRIFLDFGEISTVIPGMLNVDQVSENITASDMHNLTRTEHNKVQKVYGASTIFT